MLFPKPIFRWTVSWLRLTGEPRTVHEPKMTPGNRSRSDHDNPFLLVAADTDAEGDGAGAGDGLATEASVGIAPGDDPTNSLASARTLILARCRASSWGSAWAMVLPSLGSWITPSSVRTRGTAPSRMAGAGLLECVAMRARAMPCCRRRPSSRACTDARRHER